MTPNKTTKGRFRSDFWENIIFLVILIGLLPCIHDYSLFFLDLGSHLPNTKGNLYTQLFVNNDFPFLLALFVLPIVLFILISRQSWEYLIGLLPYFVYILSYLGVYVICYGTPEDWELALTLSCVISFLYFLVRGTFSSWVFPIFLLLLGFGLSIWHMFTFAGVALALRFVFLLIAQNWQTFGELGPKRIISTFFRSFLLWSPMLLVVAFSWYSNKFIEDQAVEALYTYSFLEHHTPIVDSVQVDSLMKRREAFAQWEDKLQERVIADTTVRYNRKNRKKQDQINQFKKIKKRFQEMGLIQRKTREDLFKKVDAEILKVQRSFKPLTYNELKLRYTPIWNSFSTIQASFTPNEEVRLRRQLKAHLRIRPVSTSQAINCQEYQAPNQKGLRLFRMGERSFERDLYISLCDTVEQMKLLALLRIDTLETEVKNAQKEVPPAAGDLIRNSMGAVQVKSDEIDLECPWYRVDCHIGQGAARAAAQASETALRDAGDKMADDIQAQVQYLADSAGRDTRELLAEVDAKVDEQLEASKNLTYQGILNTYRLLQLILFVMDLIFFFIVVKSFAYVFARVVYSGKFGSPITLEDGDETMSKGVLRKTGNTYLIPENRPLGFYVSRKYEPAGRAPKISIPQMSKNFFARIANRAWTMNYVQMGVGRSDVTFTAPGGKEFVEWELAPGEVVIFRYRNFVAMSESISLSAIISLRITSLLFGKLIFSAAQGPGTLVLSTKGKPIVGEDSNANSSIPENRLLAWHKQTHFHIESELNVFDVFFSGVYLRKREGDLVVIDSDQIGKAKSGIFKFFRHFLLPV